MRETIFKNQPKRVVYIYSTKSKFVEDLYQEGLIDKAIKNLPSTYEALGKLIEPFCKDGVIVIVDDGLSQLESSGSYLPRVFEEFTSKKNASIIFVSQSIFVNDKNFIRMSQNSHYIVCLQNRRNPARIRALALQVKPCNPNFILKCFVDATKFKPLSTPYPQNYGYGYFIFDFNLQSPECLAYRTNIFPDELEPITVYVDRE